MTFSDVTKNGTPPRRNHLREALIEEAKSHWTAVLGAVAALVGGLSAASAQKSAAGLQAGAASKPQGNAAPYVPTAKALIDKTAQEFTQERLAQGLSERMRQPQPQMQPMAPVFGGGTPPPAGQAAQPNQPNQQNTYRDIAQAIGLFSSLAQSSQAGQLPGGGIPVGAGGGMNYRPTALDLLQRFRGYGGRY